MALSYDLVSQFAKLVKDEKKTGTESTVYGTVVVDAHGDKYVRLDGSDQLTPLTDTSTNANDNERVSVLIKNHTATVTGNMSSPAARTGDVETLGDQVSEIQKFDIVLAEQIQANEGYIKQLQTDKANVGDLTAATAKITELEANKASIEQLNAAKAEITDLVADKIDAEVVNAKFATIESLNATNADIDNLEADYGKFKDLTADNLEAVDATIKNLDSTYATIKSLEAEQARITDLEAYSLTANSAEIKNLQADIADFDTLIFGSATGTTIQTSFANAVIAQLGNAQIKSAMIDTIAADKINAGNINTNNVRVVSDDGKLLISDETIQISDDTRVRVQIGKDASGDYSINVWDADGKLMFSEGGITDNAIKDAIIRNDMVSDTANISASKLDISSLFTEINNSTQTINANKVLIDTDAGTLDVAFTKMETDISGLSSDVSSQGTALSVVQGQISSKVWQEDITTAIEGVDADIVAAQEAAEAAQAAANQNASDMANVITEFNKDVANLQTQIDGSIATWFYEVVPTASNEPAKNWTTTDLKNNHLGDLYYDTITGYCYRWQVHNNQYSWQRITDTDITKALADAAAAQDTADQKRRVFYSQPTVPYEQGDLWVQGVGGDILRCETPKTSSQSYSVSDWVRASKYTDDTAANNAQTAANNAQNSVNTLTTKHSSLEQTVNGISATVGQHTTQIANKADSSTVTTVSNKVTELETSLEGFRSTVSDTYATKTSLEGVQSAAATAQSTANTAKTNAANAQTAANNAKSAADAAQTDVNALKTRVSNAETSISQNSQQIALRATKNEVTETLGGYYTKSQTDAAITTKATEITSTVEKKYQETVSKGEQLVSNGSALLGDNTNFSTWVFDGAVTNNSPGSFTKASGSAGTYVTDEYFPVNTNNKYTFSLDAKSAKGIGKLYSMLVFYDVDKIAISASQHMHNAASTTTLARDLKNGDTVIYLSDVSGWSTSYAYGFYATFWNYKNSFGYTYPAGTYSRNRITLPKTSSNTLDGNYLNTTAKTITLTTAYSGATIPSGTAVSQGGDGSTYKYFPMSAVTVGTEWKSYSGKMAGVDYSGGNKANMFPPGTAYARVGFLWNYQGSGNGEQLWITNVSVSDTTLADAAQSDVDALAANVLQNYATKSEVKQTEDSITSTVSATYATKTALSATDTKAGNAATAAAAAQNDIDNLNIGGRNLLLNTNGIGDVKVYGGEVTTAGITQRSNDGILTLTCSTQTTEVYYRFMNPSTSTTNMYALKPGETYTMSGKAMINVTSGTLTNLIVRTQAYRSGGWSGGLSGVITTASTDDWVEFEFPFTVESNATGYYVSFQAYYTGTFAAVAQFKDLKLEHGTRATDWSPAPEDVTSEIAQVRETAGDAMDSITEAETVIQQLSDSITALVRDGNGGSMLKQDSSGLWYFDISDIEETLSNTANGLDDLEGVVLDVNGQIDMLQTTAQALQERTEYVRSYTDDNDRPCLELGEGDSVFKVRITNTDIQFVEDTEVPTRINRKMLIIEKAMVRQELQFGDDQDTSISGVWLWKRRNNGNLGLIWNEVSS